MSKSEEIRKILELRLKERIKKILEKVKSEGNILKKVRKM